MISRSCSSLALALAALALTGPVPAGAFDGEDDAPAAPTWRFKKSERAVKVVVLAGSIGAWPKEPYAWHLEQMCANVEVKNLSQTGLGTWALRKRFREQVLDNRRIDWEAEGSEYWLVFGGGLNSVGTPKSTNQQARRLFLMAHARGMKVVGLSPTPWGDEGDRRFRGLEGLGRRKDTQLVVDYIMKRVVPAVALGAYADKRPHGAELPWTVEELPDISIDLYDSALRDPQAEPRDLETMRALLESDGAWGRAHRDLDETARQAQLESDANLLADLPRWYLRSELRSFDHIHPNVEGHATIAAVMCPSLPESWGCTCPDPDGVGAGTVPPVE